MSGPAPAVPPTQLPTAALSAWKRWPPKDTVSCASDRTFDTLHFRRSHITLGHSVSNSEKFDRYSSAILEPRQSFLMNRHTYPSSNSVPQHHHHHCTALPYHPTSARATPVLSARATTLFSVQATPLLSSRATPQLCTCYPTTLSTSYPTTLPVLPPLLSTCYPTSLSTCDLLLFARANPQLSTCYPTTLHVLPHFSAAIFASAKIQAPLQNSSFLRGLKTHWLSVVDLFSAFFIWHFLSSLGRGQRPCRARTASMEKPSFPRARNSLQATE